MASELLLARPAAKLPDSQGVVGDDGESDPVHGDVDDFGHESLLRAFSTIRLKTVFSTYRYPD